ncbi:kinase R-like protein [Trifolium medium]|uniref:Kinase R-like protein n=1 Tax=Trifolium medium TaxID=97028 RepID=A0A392RZW8_9FABA|nr:kinase R-like protein [Trifolium medium]
MEIDGEESLSVAHIAESCSIEMKVMISDGENVICNDKRKCGYAEEVHSEYLNGIELRWQPRRCGKQQDNHGEGTRKPPRSPLRCIIRHTVDTCIRMRTSFLC